MRSHLFVVASLIACTASAQVGLWSQLAFTPSPSPRIGAAMVYDSARDRLVLLGGSPNGSGSITETWENDGAQWVLRGNFGPNGFPSMCAVYDSQRQRTVAVRGDSSSGVTTTWEWDGTAWLQRTSAQTPPGRASFALAYDSVRGRTVMFGGRSGALGALCDTWEWDGFNWVQRSSGGPSPRLAHAMAFDAARGVTVLFGGHRDISSMVAQFGDTWEWNGSYWLEHFGVAGPSPRSEHAMAYDSVRHRTVLVGGRQVYFGSGTFADTWEWDGVAWTNMQATAPASQYASLAFDSSRQRVALFGGRSVGGVALGESWVYAAPVGPAASIVAYGSGCAGPNGVPTLAAMSGSVPRLGTTLALQLTNLPTGFLNVPVGWIGFDATSWSGLPLPLALAPFGFTGCEALLAPSLSYGLTNNGGTADWSIPIPFLPAFAGLDFYLQCGVTAIGFNPGGLVFSGGLHARVGP